MFRWIRRVAAGAALVALLLLVPETSAYAGQASLADVRAATAKYHDLGAAIGAGYWPLLSCFDQPGVGGMGQHYANTSLFPGATVNATEPEALVYEVEDGRLKLVAVEYIILQSDWAYIQAPSLLGHSFTRIDSLGIWALHAWIWKPNPNGMFQNYNPAVKMCPGH